MVRRRRRGGIHGAWPGLATQNLVRGRYLDHSVDFRNVMGDVLVRRLGNSATGDVLPGFSYQPVGLFV